MIEQQPDNSPFYTQNNDYCRRIEQLLTDRGIRSDGYCTSHGFEINARFTHKGAGCDLKLFKFQTTRNGVILPVHAADTVGCELTLTTTGNQHLFTIGQSKLRRLFTSDKMRAHFPSPWFANTSTGMPAETAAALAKCCLSENVIRFSSKKGTIFFKALSRIADPIVLVEKILDSVK